MNQKIITHLPLTIVTQLEEIVRELQILGIQHVGHGLIYPHKTPTAYFSVPEWGEIYSKEDFVSRDPIRMFALRSNYHLLPWDAVITNKNQREVVEERKKYFQSSNGVLISIKTPSFHETLCLGFNAKSLNSLSFFKTANLLGSYLLKFRAIHSQYYLDIPMNA